MTISRASSWETVTLPDPGPAPAHFGYIGGVTVTPDGSLVVTDASSHTVRRIAPSGRVETVAGKAHTPGIRDGRGAEARFGYLHNIRADGAGNVVVVDHVPGYWSYFLSLRRITPDGEVTTILPPVDEWGVEEDAYWWDGEALAVDWQGNAYLHDSKADRICRISPDGDITTVVQNATPALSGVEAIAVDRAGNLYIAGWQGKKILRYSPDGLNRTVVLERGGALEFAQIGIINGLVFDESVGDLVMTDSTRGSVYRISLEGEVRLLAGRYGNSKTHDGPFAEVSFSSTRDVAVDPHGNLFVVDSPVIRYLSPSGYAQTLAGVPRRYAHQDGTGSTRQLATPAHIVAAPDGAIIVYDAELDSIIEIDSDGNYSDLAGNPGLSGSADGIGPAATFNQMTGMALGPDGNLYLCGHTSVRRVTRAGEVTTIAGSNNESGATEGPAQQARFRDLRGIAIAPDGTIYLSDKGNTCIRRISTDGIVDTFASKNGERGHIDGPAEEARLFSPSAIACTPDGSLYVQDLQTVRRIDPTRGITTVAGATADYFAVDGDASVARLGNTAGFAVDRDGNLYISEQACVRRMTPDGTIETIAGERRKGFGRQTTGSGFIDGVGEDVRFGLAGGLTIDRAGRVVVVDQSNQAIRRLTSINPVRATPSVDWPQFPALRQGEAISARQLNATASVPGRFNSTIPAGVRLQPGTHRMAMFFVPDDLTTTEPVTVIRDVEVLEERARSGALVNLSTRSRAARGNSSLIVGLALSGTAAKPIVFRAIGPTLAQFKVPGALSDPHLSLFASDNSPIGSNDDWGGSAETATTFARLGAFPLPPDSTDAALIKSLSPGPYSVVVDPGSDDSGIALVEAYDGATSDRTATLSNLSARTTAGTGGDALTVGFVIDGDSPATVLLRGIGPTLEAYGVEDVLKDPQLRVFDASRNVVAENDNWEGDPHLTLQFDRLGAFRLLDPDSADAAIEISLPPGPYSVQITSRNGQTGVALAEIYLVP